MTLRLARVSLRGRLLFAPATGAIPVRAWPKLVFSLVLTLIAACGDGEVAVTTTTLPPSTSTTQVTTSPAAPGLTTTTSTVATTTSTTIDAGTLEIRVQSGTVVGGPGELKVELGSEVRLLVVADVDDHLHVHGYDLFFDVSPGDETRVEFVADVPGVFEIELEGAGLLLLELEVS